MCTVKKEALKCGHWRILYPRYPRPGSWDVVRDLAFSFPLDIYYRNFQDVPVILVKLNVKLFNLVTFFPHYSGNAVEK